jgi:hypothetical protein
VFIATTTVVKFMQKTADDRQLRDQLEALLGVGDGDISNEDALDKEESAALKGDRSGSLNERARVPTDTPIVNPNDPIVAIRADHLCLPSAMRSPLIPIQ